MSKSFLRTAALAAILLASSSLSGTAFAEVVYNRGNSGDPESLDPHKTTTIYENNIQVDLFEGLTMPDVNAEVIPGAAESWTVSDDGKTYTFKLRADGKWSDGSAVTADDFVYSFRRLLDPATGAEYASMLYVVKNGEDLNNGKAKPEDLGVKAIDPLTLEVTLANPTPYFLEMLTHHATFPVSKASIEKHGDQWIKPGNLLTNGAYKLVEFVPNDHIKLVKNEHFHDAGSLKIDTINYIPTEDRSTAVKRFEAGEILSNDDIPMEQFAELQTKFGDQLKVTPYFGMYYYAMKFDKEPWSNPKLRNAVSMAIDREFIAEKIWQGTMLPGYSMVPPGVKGYEAATVNWKDMSQIDREDEAAKVLAELGYGPDKPLKLEIRYNSGENHKNTAVAIQEQLKPLGIEVTLLNTDVKTHYNHLQNKGDYDVARAGWIADYKDPETFLGISRKSSGNNHSNYDSPKFEELMNKAAEAAGVPAERMKFLSEAERVLMDDQGNLPILYYSNRNIVSSKLKGWQENVMNVHPSRFMSIE